MNIKIRRLAAATTAAYSDLLEHVPDAMLYHSLRYRTFLRAILKQAEDYYLLAYDNDRLMAALPAFIMDGPLGIVVNSLPFYGSHGSIVSRPEATGAVKTALFQAFDELCRTSNAICSTIIETPFATDQFLFADHPADYTDERIGQITPLPFSGSEKEVEDQLFASFHKNTRNMVRKGAKAGFSINHDGDGATLKALHTLHDENIRNVGGIPKPWEVFQAIAKSFEYDQHYRIYTARNDTGQIVSALLLFYFKAWVEYFTPATLEEYRSQQPLSMLIYTAMKDAVIERQSRYWNWGGTWPSQEGVYRFKARWGTQDFPYRYYIREYPAKGRMLQYGQAELLSSYPYFYTVPFSQLGA